MSGAVVHADDRYGRRCAALTLLVAIVVLAVSAACSSLPGGSLAGKRLGIMADFQPDLLERGNDRSCPTPREAVARRLEAKLVEQARTRAAAAGATLAAVEKPRPQGRGFAWQDPAERTAQAQARNVRAELHELVHAQRLDALIVVYGLLNLRAAEPFAKDGVRGFANLRPCTPSFNQTQVYDDYVQLQYLIVGPDRRLLQPFLPFVNPAAPYELSIRPRSSAEGVPFEVRMIDEDEWVRRMVDSLLRGAGVLPG